MTSHNMELMKKLAPKVAVTDPQVLNEAFEIYRSIQTRKIGTMNEIDKYIVSMDIAAAKRGLKFDYIAAHKIVARKKGAYNRQLTMVKNVLQIKDLKSVNEICIKLGCEQASKAAELLLHKYKECDLIDRDFNHPQYAVASVWSICRINKIAIKKSDFVSLSNLTTQQWNKMDLEFTKFADEHGFKADNMRKTIKKKGNEFMSAIEEKAKEMEVEYLAKKQNEEHTTIESYEVWRKRILDEAYSHVNPVKV